MSESHSCHHTPIQHFYTSFECCDPRKTVPCSHISSAWPSSLLTHLGMRQLPQGKDIFILETNSICIFNPENDILLMWPMYSNVKTLTLLLDGKWIAVKSKKSWLKVFYSVRPVLDFCLWNCNLIEKGQKYSWLRSIYINEVHVL